MLLRINTIKKKRFKENSGGERKLNPRRVLQIFLLIKLESSIPETLKNYCNMWIDTDKMKDVQERGTELYRQTIRESYKKLFFKLRYEL